MKTPICDFVEQYADSDAMRLHMPGHKGVDLLGCERLDITEFDGADVLYHASGIIAQSQANATELFGSQKTFYSTEGASLTIRGMLFLLKQYALTKGEIPLILAGRNAHKTFVTAAALLDLQVEWLFPQSFDSVVSCPVTPQRLEQVLNTMEQKPTAVYLTSPDYLGNVADVKALAAVCNHYGVLLCVDNAHGAYLKFLQPSHHPLDLGAHLCCDSAHKTLPALTGAAYLHIGKTAPSFFSRQASAALSVFASTSPSYLILQSLDSVNAYLTNGYKTALADCVKRVQQVKDRLKAHGFCLVGEESLKITLAPKSYGYTGDDLAEYLLSKNIVCEFHDPDYVVLMVTPQTTDEGLRWLEQMLCLLPKREPVAHLPIRLTPPKRVLSMQEALFAPCEEIPLAQCVGRVLSAPTVACPPAVPIAVCGEELSQSVVDLMAYYGHTTCKVVKKQDV